MQKKFILNLILLLFFNLLIKPFWILVIEPHVQNEVGNAAYGEYFALFNFSFMLNILLDFGITNFNNKNIAQNNHLLTKHFSGLFMLKLMLAVIYIIATVVVGVLIKYDVRLTKLLLVLGFNQFLISLVLYLRSNIQALHLFKTDSILSVLDRIIMISIVSVMLWTSIIPSRMDVMDFVYAQTVGYFLTALIAFVAVIRKTHTFRMKWDLPFSLMILKKSFPFAILVLLMTFYNRIDSVMLERLLPAGDPAKIEVLKQLRDPDLKPNEAQKTERLHLEMELEKTGPEQAGYYAKAFRLLDATNMIAYLFSVLLLPMFSRMLKYKESVEQLVKLSFTLLITVAIVVAIGCYFYRLQIMEMLYGKNYLASVTTIFPMLMSCFAAISTTYVFGTLLTANGNLKELNIMAASGMFINILLNIILIPRFYMVGSAFAGMFTQFLTALLQIVIVQNKFKFKVNKRLLIALFLYIAGVAGINFLSQLISGNWILNFIIMVVASIAWALTTGLISVKSMFRMLKYG